MNWVQRNFRTLIYVSFLIPILLVAFVSISHVTTWYGLSNPYVWSVYLSVGIEVAALSALAAISAKMGKKVYVPFGIVTIIQFIGNIFFAYQFIDVKSEMFRDWVDLVDPIVSYLGVESGDIVGHKRFLSLFSGGMLPIISLSFLHMLVKFEEEEKSKNKSETEVKDVNLEELSKLAGLHESKQQEKFSYPSEEDIKLYEEYLRKVSHDKFGNLTEDETKQPETIVSSELPIETLDIVNNDSISSDTNVVEDKEVVDTNSEIEVEPDFYVDETPEYTMDEETTVQNPKRLNYFRSH